MRVKMMSFPHCATCLQSEAVRVWRENQLRALKELGLEDYADLVGTNIGYNPMKSDAMGKLCCSITHGRRGVLKLFYGHVVTTVDEMLYRCPICQEQVCGVELEEIGVSCGHRACADCLKSYVQFEIKERWVTFRHHHACQ